jgi:hypothetical protein
VISLIFSEKDILGQVLIFHRYFPYLKDQFIHLHRPEYVKTEYILSDLPKINIERENLRKNQTL